MVGKLDIYERHDYYLKNVSSGMMPISLGTAIYLYKLCWDCRPTYILDSGSGFSSFVFRLYKAMSSRQNVRVITIDNSSEWLRKTRNFIRESGLVPEDCYGIDTFTRYFNESKFDLIFEDYSIRHRSQRFNYDLGAIKKAGVFILDDAHLKSVRSILAPYIRKCQISVSFLKGLMDSYGRYPAVIRKV